MPTKTKLIPSLWDDNAPEVRSGDPLTLLRYRSNLLGADLRITNFGGGNTSSKYEAIDPKSGNPVRVMAVKGSGGDLGSIKESGFAILYQGQLEALQGIYRGEAHEDEMVGFYPSCAFAGNTVPASIDTPLHAFIPYPHVDHLHPDWAIALAASANGKAKLDEFNSRYGRKLVWLPWQRPGFELALMLSKAAQEPGAQGIVLGSHGLFTWGDTQQECYENSLAIINELGEFITTHEARLGEKAFGGKRYATRRDARDVALNIFPFLRGALATHRRSIGHFADTP
ncbi:MAG: class II aldolase/adducin family protein, partial [Bryobacterales bacterium]|nr:class II aldolase/adducin family protein [Bryobacterales bacterium]